MANPRQLRSLIFGLSLGGATAALAIAFMLTVIATQSTQAQTFTVLHTFTGGHDGGNPNAGVTINGRNLYGTAYYGGAGYGTVYELKHAGSGWTLNPLYTFTGGSDGAYPRARVIFGPNGTLYGTTVLGGTGECSIVGCGTVFNLRPSATTCRATLCPWTETVLYAFKGSPDGNYPELGDLLFDHAGNIYGTTVSGGVSGTVYELTPSGSGWTESVLYSFLGAPGDGYGPYSGVIFDNAGNLYGTTAGGGTGGGGTVFELMYPGWTESIVNSFRFSS